MLTTRPLLLICSFIVAGVFCDRPGRCLRPSDSQMCPNPVDKCQMDEDCMDENGKCCFTSCGRRCMDPVFTGCEQVQLESERRSRALGERVPVPKCDTNGDFEQIQCNDRTRVCWCVDKSGYEVPGTRDIGRDRVNCSNPKLCAGHMCRMLCPYGFELDVDGCPMCQCRDPCHGVKCPGSMSCQLEQVACISEPCPPIPTCKKARSLDNICPVGTPLKISESERPFLCGVDPGKPSCPPLFQCLVQTGNDYGVCCPASVQIQKPGTCPTQIDGDYNDCGPPCEHDLQCMGMQKCCTSLSCGKHCASPHNVTACLQQKMLTEILVMNEKEGKGYIPQCSPTGEFVPRQCSRNGLVCWCVNSRGIKMPRTMGPAEQVVCEDADLNIAARNLCDTNTCAQVCEYGFKVDNNGCQTCECDDPCQGYKCKDNEECVAVKEEGCDGFLCPSYPECRPISLYVNPCETGTPLIDAEMGTVTRCSDEEENRGCPSGYKCTFTSGVEPAVCCPANDRIELTKEGICPFNTEQDCKNSTSCESDMDCIGSMKCCDSNSCGRLCVDPVIATDLELNAPTMCEYLRDFSVNMEATQDEVVLALSAPKCGKDGSFEPTQCDRLGNCWCVDDYGTEIPRTRVNDSIPNCEEIRSELSCLGLTCRLGCEYGFVLDSKTRCPLCQCRNPCDGVQCKPGEQCNMVGVDCEVDYCPPVPACISMQAKELTCPSGEPLIDDYKKEVRLCTSSSQCPGGYHCHKDIDEYEGVCCTDSERQEKLGQCPYLIPVRSVSCDYECKTDSDCSGPSKCCSNGCGTQCVDPVTMTACQHQKAILEHHAHESGTPARQMYIPRCRLSDGQFEGIQCHPTTKKCWCVDIWGNEISGTRHQSGSISNCRANASCPLMKCVKNCDNGYVLNENGCRTCTCKDPCEEVKCNSEKEECRLVKVNCIDEPCPPVAMCLPKIENPCPVGDTLKDDKGETVKCGPFSHSCPTSHKCHLSPFGEYAVCCPKPRDVCFEKKDTGTCRAAVTNWFFNAERNLCEQFIYGGCGGNLNNFDSEETCKTVCPVLTKCERLREKNMKLAEKYKKVTFSPKCNAVSGDWEPIQCLEQVGVCWCVNKEGEPLKGSLTRGAPTCNFRQGRGRAERQSICPDGVNVHVCPKSLCDNKLCMAYPSATCRIDPCGGCRYAFYDKFNKEVNCSAGLSQCRKELQDVLNSNAWSNEHMLSLDKEPLPLDDYDDDRAFVAGGAGSFFPANGGTAEVWDIQPDLFAQDYPTGDEEAELRSVESESQGDVYSDQIAQSSSLVISIMKPLVKQGLCPVPSLFWMHGRSCKDTCFIDADCQAHLKCCMGDCGLRCMEPLRMPQELVPKKGKCPKPPADLSMLSCPKQKECVHDTDCRGRTKCCFNGCGATCMEPIEEDDMPKMMSLVEPQCTVDGDYEAQQTQGSLAWCLDKNGQPIHKTITNGVIKCDKNGSVIERRVYGSICQDPSKQPKVCKDECLQASCPGQPDAICKADPCNDCKVSFFSHYGEKVSCESKCSQPPMQGFCRASFRRFYFNSTSRKCEAFIYGGCQGNDNNFASMEECQRECGKPADICQLPPEVGLCKALMPRWHFNPATHSCEMFTYGGCGGNRNNFRTKEDCEARCPDLVLCPKFPMAEVEMCSRSEACGDMSCFGDDEIVCNVDPCTCTSSYTYMNGSVANCTVVSSDDFADRVDEAEIDMSSPSEVTLIPFLPTTPSKFTKTRCERLKEKTAGKYSTYVVECDSNGKFLPMQCYASYTDTIPECWCVDEAGNQLPFTSTFMKGTKTCPHVAIDAVEIQLGFAGHMDNELSTVAKDKLKEVLHDMQANVAKDQVTADVQPDITYIHFTLVGENKVDVAYYLEEMVKSKHLALNLEDSRLVADITKSRFSHLTVYDNAPELEESSTMLHREIVSEAINVETPYQTAIIVVSVVSVFIICILTVIVIMYKKRGASVLEKETAVAPSYISPIYDPVEKKSSKIDNSPKSFPRVGISTVEHEYETVRYAPPIGPNTTIHEEKEEK